MPKRKQVSSAKSKSGKVLPYNVVVSMGTKPPLHSGTGDNVCFHHGNRVVIAKLNKEPNGGEVTESTVAEVWPADREIDLADGALLTHSFNNFGATLAGLETCFAILADMVDNKPRKLTFKELQTLTKIRRVIRRGQAVHMPIKV